MKDAVIRKALAEERAGLKEIWRACFHDTDSYIDCFFDSLYVDGCATVADLGDGPVAMAMDLDGMTLKNPNGDSFPCRYLFAVATLPPFRGKGLGKAVSQATNTNLVCPAEDTLFTYYEQLGFRNYFYVDEWETVRGEYAASASGKAAECSASEYADLREAMLKGRTHLTLGKKTLAYQAKISHLLRLCGGCASVERSFCGKLHVKELLVPEALKSEALAQISALYGGEAMTVRAPSNGGKHMRRFGQLRPLNDACFEPKPGDIPYFGIAFD